MQLPRWILDFVCRILKALKDECRPLENFANDRIVQKWGVYRTPEEFIVQKASQAGHPQSLETCLPEVLKQAVESHKNQTSMARIKKRTVVTREWVKRAESMKLQEQDIKSKLDSHTKRILSNKKMLWKSLLEEHDYPDMAVVDELLQGTKLIGETDTTGLWPAKFVPATLSEIELYEISTREREAICNKVKDTPSETDDAAWCKTLEEVEKGWIVGPFDPQQVPSHYPLSRRFGVVQGEKTRCHVDDFSRPHVSACVQVTEAPKPHTIDVLASLLMQAMATSNEADSWCVRTLDLKDAYRQCAVATSSFAFSHIVVREPTTGKPKIFKMLALPFRSIKSVYAFLRIAHSLWYLATRALDVLWTNYFDDYVCCCPKSEAKHLFMTVHAFFHLLGWTFAEAGAKAIDFDTMCKALGVNIGVSLMHQGRVLVGNTETRQKGIG